MAKTDKKAKSTKKKSSSQGSQASKKQGSPSRLAKAAGSLFPSKKRKKGSQEVHPKNSTTGKGSSEVKESTDPARVAADLEKGDGHWSSGLSFPKWVTWQVFTLAWVVQTAAAVTLQMTDAGMNADGLTACWNGAAGPAISFIIFVEVMKIPSGNAKEVLKLLFPFYSENEFVGSVTSVLGTLGITPRKAVRDTYTALHALLEAPKRARAMVREAAMKLSEKAIKIDPEVKKFDDDVNVIRKMLKEYHTEKRKDIDVLRNALKQATESYEEDRKKYKKTEEFLVEYTSIKSGKIAPSIQEEAVKTYRSREELQKRYTLDQFLQIFRLKHGAAKVKNQLNIFRGSKAFTKGLKLAKAWAKTHAEKTQRPGDSGSEEDEDATAEEKTLAGDVLGDIVQGMEM